MQVDATASGERSAPDLAATGPGSFVAAWSAAEDGEKTIGVRRYAGTRLELLGGRFLAEVVWKDFQKRTGHGVAVPHRRNSGHFWFFHENDIDLTLKIVDGRSMNGHFWVFCGAVSNVAYTLKITDRVTGNTKTYLNPANRFGSIGDSRAFPGS